MSLTESIRKVLLLVVVVAIPGTALQAQDNRVFIDRDGSTIVLEPNAPNIVRVTLSKLKDQAIAGPGYGIVAKPRPAGWTYETTPAEDIYKSTRMSVHFATPPSPQRRPDGSYWNGPRKTFGAFGRGPYMTVTGSDGTLSLAKTPICC